eukprot:TRINITY_DN10857_c0_g3_i8.p1 TRINITY_DN10857_c0_g3~~TRINITY_DN10857_c0_g3_i8.p1  ORF type:complete len:875 (+),score=213.59 TRINITY_DN10857_c0_g3_i8:73-2697(+)
MPTPSWLCSFCDQCHDIQQQDGFSNMLGSFTPCFTDALVLGISYLAFILLCLIRLGILVSSTRPYKQPLHAFLPRLRALRIIIIILGTVCLLVSILHFDDRIDNKADSFASLTLEHAVSIAPYEYFGFGVSSLGWALFILVTAYEFKGDKVGKWTVRAGTVLVFAGDVAKLQFILNYGDKNDFHQKYYLLFFVSFAAKGLVALLCLFSAPDTWYHPCIDTQLQPDGYQQVMNDLSQGAPVDDPSTFSKHIYPEYRANVFSRIFFTWMTPMIMQGYKEPLVDENVWQLDSHDRATKLLTDFESTWDGNLSLLQVLWRLHKKEIIVSGFWKTLNDASQFVGPVFLNALLTSSGSVGYIYAGAIFVGLALGLLGEQQYFQGMMRVGFQVRSGMVTKLFKHSVFLSHSGHAKTESDINNLVGSDCESIQAVCQNIHNLWSAPVRIVVSMTLLYQQLGPASLTSFAVLITFVPIIKGIIKKIAMATKTSAKHTDSRVGAVNESVAFMHVIKCYAWEESTADQIRQHRESELEWLYKSACYSALNSTTTAVIPVLVSVLTFTMFSIDHTLTPAKAFTSLSLFSVLRMPLFTFPNLITQLAQAQVSLQRIQNYLSTDEQPLDDFPPLQQGQPAIEIQDGAFSWNTSSEQPTLSGINLKVLPGELVAVVGGAGFGKSSLLEAMLGEMPHVSAGASKRSIRGRVAYVPQSSWIFNGTVQDNILFGLDYDEQRFNNAVQLAQMVRDLDIMADGKYTEIGERGVNVSGGQKQRISIARAVYADADTIVLDDPLSALDASVAKVVFEDCIRTGMSGRTRVLATNQLQFVSQCDRIIFLGPGCIAEQGSFSQLMEQDLSLIHISEPTRLLSISYAVFCLKKKKKKQI